MQSAKGASSDYTFNQALGLNMLRGYPVVISDHMEDGDTASDVSAMFGNVRKFLITITRESMVFEQNPYARTGSMTFFARHRFVPMVWDDKACVGLYSAA